MQIDYKNWKSFKISEIFQTKGERNQLQVPTGANISSCDLEENGDVPRITVTNLNNGISGYYNYVGQNNQDYRVYKNFISISFLCTIFYQEGSASLDMKVHCLKPIEHQLNRYTGLFLVSVLKVIFNDSNYAEQISSKTLPNKTIYLPANNEGKPDWEYMEKYMKQTEEKAKKTLDLLKSVK